MAFIEDSVVIKKTLSRPDEKFLSISRLVMAIWDRCPITVSIDIHLLAFFYRVHALDRFRIGIQMVR
jgi:hypothetical protein